MEMCWYPGRTERSCLLMGASRESKALFFSLMYNLALEAFPLPSWPLDHA